MGPAQLLGIVDTNSYLSVEFFTDFVENSAEKSSKIKIEIQNLEFDFFSAKLRIHAHFSGLRRLMYDHPVFSSFLGISSAATLVFSLLYFFWRKIFEPSVVISANSSLNERREIARERLRLSSSQQRLQRLMKSDEEVGSVVEKVEIADQDREKIE